MIRRRKLLVHGQTRTVTRWAWWPRSFSYEGEKVWIWLEQYVQEQAWSKGTEKWPAKWMTQRTLTLADACLEKLNPKPEPLQPSQLSLSAVGQAISNQMLQQWLSAQQSSSLTQLGGFAGMQGYGQSAKKYYGISGQGSP